MSKFLQRLSCQSQLYIWFFFFFPYLELHCINETGEFLAELVHDIGIDMRSNAACVQLRRTQLGPFLLPHALLRKHWTLEHVLNNVGLCKSILSQESSVEGKSVKRIAPCNFLEEMQNVAREDLISETWCCF